MRKFLLLGVAGAALALSTSASQAVTLSYQIFDGATQMTYTGATSTTSGFLLINGTDANFTSVSGNASSAPALPSPNFSNNAFTLNINPLTAATTLTIKITATDLNAYSGNISNTFTLNSLTAASTFVNGTITNYFDQSNTAYGTGTLLGTSTFTGINSFNGGNNSSASFTTPFSETSIYTLNFKAGGASSLSASSQLIATPEPASLAVVGAGLAAVGFIRRRRAR